MSAPRTGSSRVSFYDVLGVDRDASAETIKQAWREATDKFEPGTGSGQFRLFSDAADTLLDPARRAEYDAELDGDAEPQAAVADAPQAEKAEKAGAAGQASAGGTVPLDKTTGTAAGEPAAKQKKERAPRTPLAGGWLIVTAVLTVLALVAVVLGTIAWSTQRSAAEAQDAGQQASAAAERSLGPVLSYDYRTLKADRDSAVRFLSASYRKEYSTTFDQLIESTTPGQPGPAEKTKAVVKADVTNVAIANDEPDRVRLVVFLNQSTSKDGGDPSFSLNRLGVTMVKSGNSWLVDNIVSY